MKWPWSKAETAVSSETPAKPFFLICAAGNEMIPMEIMAFDRLVVVAAVFLDETDALETLYAIEKSEQVKVGTFNVIQISGLLRARRL